MLRSAFSLLSPAGERARLSILIFHRVHAQRDALFPTEPDARRFDEICNWVKNWFKVLPLDEAVEGLVNRQLPARAACITFDDGYADNLQVALPILHKHQLPATFFITTGYLDGGRMFNDSIVELVRRSSFALLDVSGLGLECSSSLPMNDAAAKVNTILTLIGELKYRPPEVRLELCLLLQKRAGVSRLPDDLMMRMRTWLVRDRGDGLRGSSPLGQDAAESQEAVTHIKSLDTFTAGGETYSLIECRLETGRTHQIRIHLSELGHMLCGEKTYTHALGEKPRRDPSAAPRQILHAAVLGFVHPVTGEQLAFRTKLPRDLQDWLTRLKKTSR